MPVFDAASAMMAVLMAVWNVLIMILKYTLVTFLVMLVAAPGSWIEKFFFDIVLILSYLLCKFIVSLQVLILDICVDSCIAVMKSFPDIVVSDVVTNIQSLFTGIALSLVTGFFIYQLIRNTFAALGFDGEGTLNTLIAYIVVITLLMFSNNIISVLLQVTYDISILFINSLGSFSDTLAGHFTGFLTMDVASDSRVNLATNFLTVIVLGKIIAEFLDIAYSIVLKMVSISVLIMIGPIAISFGVLKSMRSVLTGWIKAVFGACLIFILYSVVLFYIANTVATILPTMPQISGTNPHADIVKLFIICGLVMSTTKIESLVITTVFYAQPSGTAASFGIDIPNAIERRGKDILQFVGTPRQISNPFKGK